MTDPEAPRAATPASSEPAPEGGPAPDARGLSRRAVLAGGLGVGILGAGVYAWLRARGYEVDPPPNPMVRRPQAPVAALPGPPFDPRARETLAAMYRLLLPGDPERGIPSAEAAGVLVFVERAARLPGLRPIRDDLLKLARYLDLRSAPDRFPVLDVARSTQVLLEAQSDHQPRGRFVPSRALEVALRFGLEGYLGHPHHGGNAGFSVWEAFGIRMPRERLALAWSHDHGEHGGPGGHGGHGGHGAGGTGP